MNPAVPAHPPAPDPPDLCRFLLERSPMPTAELEGAGHVLRYVNSAFCRLVGKAKAALIGTPFAVSSQHVELLTMTIGLATRPPQRQFGPSGANHGTLKSSFQ